MARYTLDTEADLSTVVEVYDETLGLFYSKDLEIYNVPLTGRMETIPTTQWDPPESQRVVELGVGPDEVMNLIEEQDDGETFTPTCFILDSGQSIHSDLEAFAAIQDEGWTLE